MKLKKRKIKTLSSNGGFDKGFDTKNINGGYSALILPLGPSITPHVTTTSN
ncbi:hypothetical protein L1077_27150 [Pseudoalteromonas luteoviolacea]|uniref:hypothetical protein n=1 Tax=Pseudoalteromonas luteoviolacea TaxID=43657 RepID=UPI001F369991|nr:hypothetical protein [Pseudoalteromonas luteoviolacea]MCF6443105.1 hypothetical protein [Pseudoalteromonas luteoviolacea]